MGTSLLVILLGQGAWTERLRDWGQRLSPKERLRKAVVAAGIALYVALLGLHLALGENPAPFLVLSAVIVVFFASQFFWFRRIGELAGRLIPSRAWRRALGVAGLALFAFIFAFNIFFGEFGNEPTHMTLRTALFEAPFRWWFLSSLLGFLVVVALGILDRLARALVWIYRRAATAFRAKPATVPEAVSTSRRIFLERAATVVAATPFFASAYGLLYERLNLETASYRVRLTRLPKAFHGFRVAQLSDIHIGPFMSAEEIRKYVAIANALRPDLVLLTGDFITWDAATQGAVVEEMARLKAPFGIFGSLGNHELWTDAEDSITKLFAARGIRILRQERALIQSGGETLNLIGVDYQSVRWSRSHGGHTVRKYLDGLEPLVAPGTANILMSHNPNTFDRAPELGIDLSLSGHTHGGQVTLEFIHPSLSPSRLITKYVKGWFKKGGSQLYVNRGIGTIGVPIRLGSPPEITLFELVREA